MVGDLNVEPEPVLSIADQPMHQACAVRLCPVGGDGSLGASRRLSIGSAGVVQGSRGVAGTPEDGDFFGGTCPSTAT